MAESCYRFFFQLSSVTYLQLIDYFSKYTELQHLHHTTAPGITNALKTCYARFGIHEEIVADSDPHLDSRQFSNFCWSWDIFFNPSSLNLTHLNGQVERCVQTIKSSLNKSAKDYRDVPFVLMEYMNAPVDGLLSPTEI